MAKGDAAPVSARAGGHVSIPDRYIGWYSFGVGKGTDKVKIVISAAPDARTFRVGEVEIWGSKAAPGGPGSGGEEELLNNPSLEDTARIRGEGTERVGHFPTGWDCRVCTSKGVQAVARRSGALRQGLPAHEEVRAGETRGLPVQESQGRALHALRLCAHRR